MQPHDNTPHDVPMKQCTQCGESFPATREYFYGKTKTRSTFYPHCKSCHKAIAQKSVDRIEKNFSSDIFEFEDSPPLKKCSQCGEQKPATLEYFYIRKSSKDGLRGVCIDCRKEQSAQWVKENPEQARKNGRIRQARQRKKRREIMLRRTRKWKRENPDKIREYRENNRDKFAVYSRRRADRKSGLPHELTPEEWQIALDYFDNCCAVCNRPLNGLFHTPAIDHWVPISNPECPGTVATNCIPLCHGIGGCNNSKSSGDPWEWLVATFGSRKAHKIHRRIQTYFKKVG